MGKMGILGHFISCKMEENIVTLVKNMVITLGGEREVGLGREMGLVILVVAHRSCHFLSLIFL